MGGRDAIYSNCIILVVHSQLVYLLDGVDEVDERCRQHLEFFEVEQEEINWAINCDVVIVMLCGDSGCTL